MQRAWIRIVFVLVHVAFVITNVSALVSAVWQRTHLEPVLFRGALVYDWRMSSEQIYAVLFMDTWGTFGRVSLLAVGIYLAALIARGDKRVPKYYVWYGAAILAFEVVLNQAQLQLWDIPRGTTNGSNTWHMAVYAAAMVGWVVYVTCSRKVRETFVHEPRAMGPRGRFLIGLGALALIVWPFALNTLVDATTVLAGRISPKEVTAGEGFAQGLLAMSVGTGLFVLMKHAWHARTVWMAVLLPVCFAALVILYQVQSFVLHY